MNRNWIILALSLIYQVLPHQLQLQLEVEWFPLRISTHHLQFPLLLLQLLISVIYKANCFNNKMHSAQDLTIQVALPQVPSLQDYLQSKIHSQSHINWLSTNIPPNLYFHLLTNLPLLPQLIPNYLQAFQASMMRLSGIIISPKQ